MYLLEPGDNGHGDGDDDLLSASELQLESPGVKSSARSVDPLCDLVSDVESGISASPLIFNISAVFKICGNCSCDTFTSP